MSFSPKLQALSPLQNIPAPCSFLIQPFGGPILLICSPLVCFGAFLLLRSLAVCRLNIVAIVICSLLFEAELTVAATAAALILAHLISTATNSFNARLAAATSSSLVVSFVRLSALENDYHRHFKKPSASHHHHHRRRRSRRRYRYSPSF